MSDKPSEPILALLRKLASEKGLNTAALAEAAGMKRGHVRKLLAGRAPLTVDEMVWLAQALEIDMNSLAGLPEQLPDEPLDLRPAEGVSVDPYGLQAEQAIKLAFAMGCNFAFVADTSELGESGIPQRVLEAHERAILIQLDAAYHRHNDPRYSDWGLSLTLSFDGICHCELPWSSIIEVRFVVERPEPGPRDARDDAEEEQAGGVLRLVT